MFKYMKVDILCMIIDMRSALGNRSIFSSIRLGLALLSSQFHCKNIQPGMSAVLIGEHDDKVSNHRKVTESCDFEGL